MKNQFQAPVLSLGGHNHYKNQTLWLRLDMEELNKTTEKTIAETTFVLHKKPADLGFLLPPHERFTKKLNSKRAELAEKNKHWLSNNQQLLQKIANYHREYTYPAIPNLDTDAALYQLGFPSKHDQSQCAKFHSLPLDKKHNILSQFHSAHFREQAIRVLGRHFHDQLSEEEQQDFADYLNKINVDSEEKALVDYRNNKRLTPKGALEQTDKLLKTTDLTERQAQLLLEFREYLKDKYAL